MKVLCLYLLLAIPTPSVFVPHLKAIEQQADSSASMLTNKDILEMVAAGLSADVILAKIDISRCEFDTSTDSLKVLKAAKVPDSVILAMVKAPSNNKPAVQPEPTLRVAKVTCLSVKEVPLLPAPSDSHPIRQVTCGSDIAVLAEQDQWIKVRTLDGTKGFLSVIFVSKNVPVSQVVSDPSLHTSAPSNMIRAVAWRAVPWATTSYYQTPGSANTDCLGSGSWVGNIWQGSASCSTQYTPAQTVPVNWQHVTVFNLVETGNTRMVIACTRNWAFSKCTYLVPGNMFHFEMKNGKVEVFAHKGGSNKKETLTFDIMSNQLR